MMSCLRFLSQIIMFLSSHLSVVIRINHSRDICQQIILFFSYRRYNLSPFSSLWIIILLLCCTCTLSISHFLIWNLVFSVFCRFAMPSLYWNILTILQESRVGVCFCKISRFWRMRRGSHLFFSTFWTTESAFHQECISISMFLVFSNKVSE